MDHCEGPGEIRGLLLWCGLWRSGGMNRRTFTLAALVLGGRATRAVPVVAPAASSFAELEPLLSAEAGRSGLTISVLSNGCTTKGDFTFYLERRGPTMNLAFSRKHVDACNTGATRHTNLSFSWAELGVAPHGRVLLLNPLGAGGGQQR